MAGPQWARWTFALLFVVVGALAATQPARRGTGCVRARGRRAEAADHVLTAAGMAVMFLPVATPVPPRAWATVFAGLTGWVLWRLVRAARTGEPGGHLPVHLATAATMVLAFGTMPPDGLSDPAAAHPGHLAAAGTAFAVVGWLAAAYFLAHVVWCGVRLAAPPAPAPGPVAATAADDRLPLMLTMGLGMSYMLVTML